MFAEKVRPAPGFTDRWRWDYSLFIFYLRERKDLKKSALLLYSGEKMPSTLISLRGKSFENPI